MARSLSYRLNQLFTFAVLGVFFGYIGFAGYHFYDFAYPPTCDHEGCRGPADSPGQRYHARIFKGKKLSGTPLWEAHFAVKDEISEVVNVDIPQRVRDDKPYYGLLVITHDGLSHNRNDDLYDTNTRKVVIELTRLAAPIRINATSNLLDKMTSTDSDAESVEAKTMPPEYHMRPRVTVNMVDTDARFTIYTQEPTSMPVELIRHPTYKMTPNGYLPWFGIDDLGLTRKDLHRVNDSHTSLPILFEYKPASIGKFRLWLNLEGSLTTLSRDLGFGEKDIDQMRKMYTETNPYLLIVTILVSLVHLLFDILAFKNDIGFWQNNKSMGGLSFRGVLGQAVCNWVILLNLIETDQASPLILFGIGGTSLIDTWKVYRALQLRKVVSTNKNEAKTEAETRKYDEYAMKRLSYILFPGVLAAAVYSFAYEEHTRFYSWFIGSLANGVYVFGFVLMTPQLFINYKLKSVARMPWKAFVYRSFNTFVDDLFSFIITMPLAHRLACFRDDIVFFVFLYQRWIYPVDESRKMQFFEEGEEDDDSTTNPAKKKEE